MSSPEVICKRIVSKSGSNFAASFLFLDAEQRRAMRALYAYCRVIDDIVDEPGPLDVKATQLAAWRERIAALDVPDALPGVASEHLGDAICSELRWAREHFALPSQYLRELIDGVEFDLQPGPMPDYESLLQYCYGVAGTVGLSCLGIFRVEDTPETKAAGLALANAFQLTNIIRDVQGDAEIGRCYIPAEDMGQFELEPEDFLHDFHPPHTQARVVELVSYYAERAEAFYRQAWEGFAHVDAVKLRPARVMSDYYYSILQAITHDPLCVLRGRTSVSWAKKCAVLLKAWSV